MRALVSGRSIFLKCERACALLLLALAPAASAQGEPKVSAQLSSGVLRLGETAYVNVTVENAADARIVQVPVNYRPRVGVSSVTGELGKTIPLGLEMLSMVLKMRVGAWPRSRRA